MSHRLAHTMFALAFDERQPEKMSCTTNGGKVYSLDGGETWITHRRRTAPRSTPWRAAEATMRVI
jgi:hypothetical protein